AALALMLFGFAGFGLVPPLQYRVQALAGPGRDLAATMPASAVTGGIAVGSFVGGVSLQTNRRPPAIPTRPTGCAPALPVAVATARLRPPAVDETTASAAVGAD